MKLRMDTLVNILCTVSVKERSKTISCPISLLIQGKTAPSYFISTNPNKRLEKCSWSPSFRINLPHLSSSIYTHCHQHSLFTHRFLVPKAPRPSPHFHTAVLKSQPNERLKMCTHHYTIHLRCGHCMYAGLWRCNAQPEVCREAFITRETEQKENKCRGCRAMAIRQLEARERRRRFWRR